jgi:dUTP pyrophosphatase
MRFQPTVKFRRLPHGEGLPLPAYATDDAVGMDICCARDDAYLAPGGWDVIPTGFAIEVPKGFEAQVRPRSGLAVNHGVTVLNSPGTIDSDYRGELRVVLINNGQSEWWPSRGDRIAQLIIAPVSRAIIEEAETLSETARGDGGFGSTGI